ncbi:HNH endonuclease [Natronorubrum sp. JWXQ-INN-674]|uniref:HNH endonuclease n=2 Tax=Natronorubrum halalkaliphilum TaxID=2691917 RepID=A0A6B0VLI7_9EURY|nr:HNH endonuclease [Natronorubrum halalkaliphilum]
MMDERQPGRDLYWRDRDGSSYRCPGCGRPRDAVDGIELHHQDRRRNNNDPDNLIGLCRDCHQDGEHGNRRLPSHLEAPAPRDVDAPKPATGGPS